MKKFLPLFLLLGLAVIANAHGISEADKQAIADGGNLRYLWLGAIHMVTGYDHLLFLFGVIFYLTGVKDILKFVTAFTVGHSITLILATFMKITADYFLVDAVIALSVCYKAFDNLDGFRKYLKINPPHLLAMIAIFGLIHGFGLSTRLQQLPLPEEGLLTRILCFNVGVELGQVAALSVLVLLLAGWRRTESFRKLGGIANILLLAAGIGLFIYQLNGFFRGEGHHHEEDHHHEESHELEGVGHSHDEAESHSHDGEPHSHEGEEHSHEH
jgi:hydrogenase/urease accessory protein HupE